MFSKLVGAVSAVAVFLIYFWWRGTAAMVETAVGFLLTAAVGLWAWWATDRRLDRLERERRALEHKRGDDGGAAP